MNTTDELALELSKGKIIFLLLGAIAFVAASVWMFSLDSETIRKELPFRNPLLVHGVGIAGMVFFGLGGLIGLRKLLDKKPGLVLNSSGIIDNSSGIS
ncbi:MAG TPA: STM3941 family protein, partial [Candidatus Angelobacter sp.]|nr:STM3941 family protein [Candidatus Angelobacter sp.]